MYQAPEVFHLERAVKAIKENLMPQKQTEAEPEDKENTGTESEVEEQGET